MISESDIGGVVGAALRLTENNGSGSRDVGRVRDSLSDNDRYA